MLNIVTIPNPILRTPSTELSKEELLSEEIQQLITDMFPAMHGDDGIGLAAPQVGRNIRIFTIGKDALPKKHLIWKQVGGNWRDLAIINPVWEKTSKKTKIYLEGCLSVPNVFGKVKRWKDIHLTGLSQDGSLIDVEISDYFAWVTQHETDHLNGVLFIDKATNLEAAEGANHEEIIAILKAEGVKII